ncbi:MAG: hypothetical protein KAJ32_02350 [Gammaproteobacteria bacterium]|nr:hypothetical protein [Gammaproteobacteria bacterium]
MRVFLRAFLVPLGLTLATPPVLAFDDDFEINDINLSTENFLDIKAHRYRKSLEYWWFDSLSGWRINIVSLNTDLAFTQTELKLENALSEYVNIRLEVEQEVFYADKDFPLPTVEAEVYPWAGNVGFSLLGTPAYGKREMDLGVALIWGRRPWNYIRFEYLEVDSLYNKKNDRDNTFYSKEPIAMKLEGAYQFDGHYKLRFTVSRDKPLELVDPDNNGIFKHKASDYFLLFDYQPATDSVIGMTINGFTLDKSSSQTGQDQQQATDYVSVDVYWVRGMGKPYELRVGTQYDHISNDIRDFITGSDEHDYFMKTLQIYTTAYHPLNEHMAWDLGLYVGQVEEKRNFLLDASRDTLNDDIEAKFRMGFEYSSSDGRNSLQFNISLNLDDPINDQGDGGAISFQSVF